MADDFKVIIPPNYTVRGAQSKRDHQTDSALQSLPEQHRGQHHSKEQHDRCEFSTDASGEEEDAEKDAQQDNEQDRENSERQPLPPKPPPPSEPVRKPDPPKPDVDTDADAGEGELPPGSMLDVEA